MTDQAVLDGTDTSLEPTSNPSNSTAEFFVSTLITFWTKNKGSILIVDKTAQQRQSHHIISFELEERILDRFGSKCGNLNWQSPRLEYVVHILT